MKATLNFDLQEEHEELTCAINGSKWKSIVSDVNDTLRGKLKYDENLDLKTRKELEELRNLIFELCQDSGVDLWED